MALLVASEAAAAERAPHSAHVRARPRGAWGSWLQVKFKG